jgi:hypothetical protein
MVVRLSDVSLDDRALAAQQLHGATESKSQLGRTVPAQIAQLDALEIILGHNIRKAWDLQTCGVHGLEVPADAQECADTTNCHRTTPL